MQAIKDNKVYTVDTAVEAKAYKAQGFDIYGDDGKLQEHGAGKTVSFEKFEALEKAYKDLKKENAKLTKELEKLKKSAEAKD